MAYTFTYIIRLGVALVIALSICCLAGAGPALSAVQNFSAQAHVSQAYGKQPMGFEVNQGQTDPEVRFLSRGRNHTIFLTPKEVVLTLNRATDMKSQNLKVAESGSPYQVFETAVLRLELVGTNPSPEVSGSGELTGRSNYLIGMDPENWHINVPSYSKVHYDDIYPGVDIIYYGNSRQLEYDFVVAPGADPGIIRIGFKGADKISLDDEGNLILHVPGGEIIQRAPHAYQEIDGRKQSVASRYVPTDRNRVGFEVASYDTSKPLIIDPVLLYSTFFGGSDIDAGLFIVVDDAGYVYVAGETRSADYPTVNPIQSAYGGSHDAFVLKMDPSGSGLVYSTYIGGNYIDSGNGIAVDGSGNAFVIGWSSSTDFPTVNPLQAELGGMRNAFVAKLNPSGTALVYSTYLGGYFDEGRGIAVDAEGNAYLTGETYSPDFPLMNPLQAEIGGINDAFVAKLNAAGSALVYSTYLGGSINDAGRGIVVDTDGNAYVTGVTSSPDFPIANAFQSLHGGEGDVFVTKLNADGSDIIYSTYLGGIRNDSGHGIAIDGSNNAYVTGFAGSFNFPVVFPFQTAQGGEGDAFAVKLSASGSYPLYSTYLGGTKFDSGHGITVDASGCAYITGVATSTDFPTENPMQESNGGSRDAFVTKLNETGSALVYSTYIGGEEIDSGNVVAVDASGNAYVTGLTDSTDFPVKHPLQPELHGLRDAFITKLDPTGSRIVYSTYQGGGNFDSSSVDEGRGIVMDTDGNAYITGFTGSVDFPLAGPLQTSNGGDFDVFVSKLDPTGSTLIYSTYLGGSSSDSGKSIAVDSTGSAYITGLTNSIDFPVQGPFQADCAGSPCSDAFVAKLDSTGSVLLYSTYLGGSEAEVAHGLAADASGNAYVTGVTRSTDFPTVNPIQPVSGGGNDIFITKLDASGSSAVYSTYLGGSDFDAAIGMDIDDAGNAYITGFADSNDFPLVNPLQSSLNGDRDAFVAKLDSTGSVLLYCTYLGGSDIGGGTGIDEGHDIVVDALGGIFITGRTDSNDFPLVNPFQPVMGGNGDTFVARLDPTGSEIIYSTFLGGSDFDAAIGIDIDDAGYVYVTGETWSADYPTVSPIQSAYGGSTDAFVAKLDPAGSELIYSTYLGGSNIDGAIGISVDASGNACIIGWSDSGDFPTATALQPEINGSRDVIVAKLNPAGSALVYSTYLGGSGVLGSDGMDSGRSITVDDERNVYVTGMTDSTNFPVTNPLQAANSGSFDVFVAKLNSSGTEFVYSTYLGGSGFDSGYGIAVDAFGSAYITGVTGSTDFFTVNPLQPESAGAGDAFVAKLSPAGTELIYSTYLGGIYSDSGNGIAIDASGNAYITGITDSDDFPTVSPLQPNLFGLRDAFVTKVDAAGSALVYSTYLGGSGIEGGLGIAADTAGSVYITGITDSIDFPTVNPMQQFNAGAGDAFVAKLDPAGSALVYSTYLGGSDIDSGNGIAVDMSGIAYIAGVTSSADFPTVNSFQAVSAGAADAFAAKLDHEGSALVYSTYLGGSEGDNAMGIAVSPTGHAYVIGWTDSADFPTTESFQPDYAGLRDAFVVKFDPVGSAVDYSTYFGGSDFDSGHGIAVDASGNAYVTGVTSSIDFPLKNPLPLDFGGFNDAFMAKINSGPEIMTTLMNESGQNILKVSFINGSETPEDIEFKIWAVSPELDVFLSMAEIPSPVTTLFPMKIVEAINTVLPDVLPFPGTAVGGRFLDPVTGSIISESICMTVPCYGQMISSGIDMNASGVGIVVSLTQDMIRVSLSNDGAASKEVEVKFWIDSPGPGFMISVLGHPSPVIALPPGQLDNVINIPLPDFLPFPGTTIGGRLLNPGTGAIMSESLCTAVPCN